MSPTETDKGLERYDLAILGAGPGGYVAAIRASQLGLSVVLVEKRETLGGTCLNIGCIPSKALLDSSEYYFRAQRDFPDHGILLESVKLDLSRMMERKGQIVEKLTSGVAQLMKGHKVTTLYGRAEDLSPGVPGAPGAVKVTLNSGGVKTVRADRILLATGSVPQALPFLPVDGKRIVTSTEALSFSSVPRELAVIGAGAIGLELGSVWSRLGSKVTVIEIMPEILPGWDSQVSVTLRRELAKQGLTFELATEVTGFDMGADHATLKASGKKKGNMEIKAERVLIAVGRKPYTEGLNLQGAGVEQEKGGRIKVDSNFQTNIPHIYAIGDLIAGPMLAHKAEEEGIAFAEIVAGKAGHVNYETIPNVVYTWPEAASAGLTEEKIKEQGIPFARGTFPFRANGRALAMGAGEGFVKVLTEQDSDRILGIHIVGPWASTLIAEAVAVMEFGGSAEDIARTIHAHPTLSEAMREAALAVDGRAIHAL